MCPFLLSVLGSHLVQTHADLLYAAVVSEFLYALDALCLEGLVFLVSSIYLALTLFLTPLPGGSLVSEGKDLMEDLSLSAYCLGVGLSLYFHLL